MENASWAAGFFLIAHDEFTGKLRVNPDLLGCGLVAAQLGQLATQRSIAVGEGRVTVPDEGAVGDHDEIAVFVLDSIRQQTMAHTVRTWTGTLAEVLYELVGRQLVATGVVRRETGSGLLRRRRPDRFPSVDLLQAARPRLRLESMLRRPQEFDLQGAFTAALLWALDADAMLDPELDRAAARELVAEIGDRLPPALQEVLTGTRAAAAAVSLTVRR